MTKRWLSLLLVLMLAIPTFGMTALAEGAFAFEFSDPDPTTGAITVTFANADGASVRYNYAKDVANEDDVADPTETSGTLYTEAFKLTEIGTYTLKAIMYGPTISKRTAKATQAVTLPLPSSVTVNPPLKTISGHTSQTFTATVLPAAAEKGVTWYIDYASASDSDAKEINTTTVADIGQGYTTDYNFKITSFTEDSLVIEGDGDALEDGFRVYAKAVKKPSVVSDKSKLIVTSVGVNGISAPEGVTVAEGETVKFKASALPANISFSKSGLKAAIVGDSGNIAAVDLDVNDEVDFSGIQDLEDFSWEFAVKGVKAGTQNVELTAFDSRTFNVPITVTTKNASAPVPELSQPDGTVFGSANAANNVVRVTSVADTANATLKYSLDDGTTWTAVANGKINIGDNTTGKLNESVTVMFKNAKTDNGFYTEDSTPISATYISAVEADSMTLAPEEIELTGIDEDDLTAELKDDVNGDNVKENSVTFVSSDPTVATVEYKDEAKLIGVVKSVKAGTATITVTSADGKVTEEALVTVNAAPVATVKVKQGDTELNETGGAKLNINVGDTLTLVATAYDVSENKAFNQNVTWAVEPAGIITIDGGKVVGVAKGNAKVTVTSEENKEALVKFDAYVAETTGGKLYTPYMDPASNVKPGDPAVGITITFHQDNEDADIHYTTDGTDPTLDSEFVANGATLKLEKTTTVKAKAFKIGYEPSDIKTETYTFNIPAEDIKLDKETATLRVGETVAFTATVTPADSTDKVTWTVDNTKAKIDANGVLTALAVTDTDPAEVVTVTATANAEVTATCKVTILPKQLGSLTIEPNPVDLKIGYTRTLTYTGVESKAISKDVGDGWKTSDPTVVVFLNASQEEQETIDSTSITTGSVQIIAKGKGTANVTLTINGVTATCAVTVAADPSNKPGLPTAQPTITLGETTFNGVTGEKAELVLGTIKPATGDDMAKLLYYNQFGLKIYDETQTSGLEVVKAPFGTLPYCYGEIRDDGTIVLVIPEVGAKPVVFNWQLNSKAINDYTGNWTFEKSGDIQLNVEPAPVYVIDFKAETVAPIEKYYADIDENVELGKVNNYAELVEKGYEFTATCNLTDAKVWTPAISDAGIVTLAVKAPAIGEYEAIVTIGAAKGTTALESVAAPAVKVVAKDVEINIVDVVIPAQEMTESEKWGPTEVASVSNFEALQTAGYEITANAFVTKVEGAQSVTVDKGWTAAYDKATGKITLEVTDADVGVYEASVNVEAAMTGAETLKAATAKIAFTVISGSDPIIEVASGHFTYNKKGALLLAKSQLTGVKFVLDNGKDATWSLAKGKAKKVKIAADGTATIAAKPGDFTVKAVYKKNDGTSLTLTRKVKVVATDAMIVKEKVGRKYTAKIDPAVGTVVAADQSISLKLMGKHGVILTESVNWTVVSGEEFVKIAPVGVLCTVTGLKEGTAKIRVADFTGAYSEFDVKVTAKGIKAPKVEKVTDFIDIG